MSTFIRKLSVKVIAAIVCILLLISGMLCGFLTILLGWSGGFHSSTALYDEWLPHQLSEDAAQVLFNYFDPEDPTHPWVSYYEGGIYDGTGSNFRYQITDNETGNVVLGTYSKQEEADYQTSETHTWSVVKEAEADYSHFFTLENPLFTYNEDYYLYDEENACFGIVFQNVAKYLAQDTAILQLSEDVVETGFFYEDIFYTFNGDEFLPSVLPEGTVEAVETRKSYTIDCYLLTGLPHRDMYREMYHYSHDLSYYRYEFLFSTIACLALGLLLLIYLCCVTGRPAKGAEACLAPIHRFPGDVALLALIIISSAVLSELSSRIRSGSSYDAVALLICLSAFLSVMLVYLLVSLCARVKNHSVLHTTLIVFVCRHAKSIGRFLYTAGKKQIVKLPLIWKVMVCYAALCLVELIFLLWLSWSFNDFLIFLFFVEKLLLGALVAYVALSFLRLKKGAEAIARGDYDTKVSTQYLVLDFKDTADTLNHIRDGMNDAVESRMKSEHLKTELITNVSHDLKTPLTSIVTYVDLLKKEPAGSTAAEEYIKILDRQSARLKKLVEDLVEASKASTGNLPVQKEVLDFGMLLGQALGEYRERLEQAGLTLVAKLPDYPVMISADGRYLWRILDNLLGNTVKYAMPGTRFYVTLTAGTHAAATFRNISKEELDVPADELLERFVRGDSSRHTEGSGLGLSIAKNLAESMGGDFVLAIDADLFKAAVIFPLLQQEEPEETPSLSVFDSSDKTE